MEIISERSFYTLETKAKWDTIIYKSEVTDIGQQYEYNVLWWKTFKNNFVQKNLFIVIDSDNDHASIWPLMIRSQYFQIGLHTIGQIDGFITDYTFPIIIEPQDFLDSLTKFVDFLRYKKLKWNYLKINIPAWTEYFDTNTENTFQKIGEKLIYRTKLYDKYAYITTGDNFESFLAGLGYKTRADIRKYLRIFENDDFSFKVHEGDKISDLFTDMVNLNSSVWHIFNGNENLNVHFIQALVKEQKNINNGKMIMPVLYFKDKAIAVVFGFIEGNRCFLHTAGIERKKLNSISPGITLYALIIKYLIKKDIKVLDLSPGVEEYKMRLGAQTNCIIQLVVFKDYYSKFIYSTGLWAKNILVFYRK